MIYPSTLTHGKFDSLPSPRTLAFPTLIATDPSRAVFLSYASQDADAARRLCATLRATGIEIWFDQCEMRGGGLEYGGEGGRPRG